MAKDINSYCTVCGKGYHLCMSCKDKMKLTPWKTYTDTSEHYKIHQIIVGYQHNIYTKSEARKKFANVDLSDLNNLKPDVKNIINEIIGGKSSVVKKTTIK